MASRWVPIAKVVLTVIMAAVVYYVARYLVLPLLGRPEEELNYYGNLIRAAVILGAGAAVVNIIGNAVIYHLRETIKHKAYAVGNLIKVIGVIMLLFYVLYATGLGLEIAVLGGTVTGLVLGLALQPVLGNLFAGLIILVTRFIEVGDVVRIVAGSIPYVAANLPLYKYFSPDYISVGYKGRVVELGFIYSTVVLDTGFEMKVPNMVLLNSAVVDYTPKWSEKQVIFVRLELPLSVIDLDKLEEELREVLRGFNVVGLDLNEQSDKEYVIVRVKVEIPHSENWRRVKSEVLKRLLKYREGKISANLYRYLCLTRGTMCDKYLAQL